ncbi:MAG: hypothetical protein U0N22_08220, partial [Acutalibacter sp.]
MAEAKTAKRRMRFREALQKLLFSTSFAWGWYGIPILAKAKTAKRRMRLREALQKQLFSASFAWGWH